MEHGFRSWKSFEELWSLTVSDEEENGGSRADIRVKIRKDPPDPEVHETLCV